MSYFTRAWFKFCIAYLTSPMLIPLVINLHIAFIITVFTEYSAASFILAIAIMVVSNHFIKKLVVESIAGVIRENPGVPFNELTRKLTEKTEGD